MSEGIMEQTSFTVFRADTQDTGLVQQAITEVNLRSVKDDSAILSFLKNRNNFLLLAIQNDQVLGSLNGYSLQHPHSLQPQFLLYEIDVRPEQRRKGIGQALINEFIKEARDANAFEIWVLSNEANSAAIELYKKCGFNRRNTDDVMLSMHF